MKLIQATVSTIKLAKGKKEALFFDDDIPGFGLRVRSGGSKNWIFQYRIDNKQRQLSGHQTRGRT
jgi:hypothetical protein